MLQVIFCCYIPFTDPTIHAQELNRQFNHPFYAKEDTAHINKLITRASALETHYFDSSLRLLKEALAESRQGKYTYGIARALYGFGVLFNTWNKDSAALPYYLEAVPYCKASKKYSHLLTSVYTNIGYTYSVLGAYQNAAFYIDSALGLPDMNLHHDGWRIVKALNNLGGIHYKLGQYDRALHYVNRAENLCRKEGFYESLAFTLGRKGFLLKIASKYNEAEKYYNEGLALVASKVQDSAASLKLLTDLKSSLAEIKLAKNNPREALKMIEDINLNNKDKEFYFYTLQVNPMFTKSRIYIQLGAYADAAQLLQQLVHLSNTDLLPQMHLLLSQVYDSMGNYQKALYHHRVYQNLQDSLFNEQKTKDINELDIRYQTLEKDRDLAKSQLKNAHHESRLKQQRLWIIGISLVLLLAVVIMYSGYKISKHRQKHKDEQINLLQKQQEINHLKDIIHGEERERVRIARELHDGIVSQLMAVRLQYKGMLRQAGENLPDRKNFNQMLHYLDDVTKELRKTAHNLMPEIVLQGGLIAAIHTHAAKMSGTSGIRIIIQHFGDIVRMPPEAELSLYRIAQELIQNALKHAKCNYILIEISFEEQFFSMTVEDNGIGMVKMPDDERLGMGLRSICMRVDALGGTIDIAGREGKGTTVNMEFDISKFAGTNHF